MTAETLHRPRLDPLKAWDGLTAEQQRKMGAAAIVQALGADGEMNGLAPLQGYVAAAGEGTRLLLQLLEDAGLLDEGGNPPLPDLGVLGIHTCRACGCTEELSCATVGHEACGWAEPDLCTTCAEGGWEREGGEGEGQVFVARAALVIPHASLPPPSSPSGPEQLKDDTP